MEMMIKYLQSTRLQDVPGTYCMENRTVLSDDLSDVAATSLQKVRLVGLVVLFYHVFCDFLSLCFFHVYNIIFSIQSHESISQVLRANTQTKVETAAYQGQRTDVQWRDQFFHFPTFPT